MTHFRKQLRDQVETLLTSTLSGHTVYVNRQAVIEESKLPAVTITTDLDRRRPTTVHDEYDAEVDLTITIYRKAVTNIDDSLDADCALVEAALLADTTIDADKELQATGIDFADADKVTGQAQMDYLITLYGIDSAETVI